MKKIAIISDTHGYIDDNAINHIKKCDELWHAGDIGNIKILDYLQNIIKTKAVYGNIDGAEIRKVCPENLFFKCEGINILMTHIGGRPEKYNKRVQKLLINQKPDIFICGHSHILIVKKDKKFNLLHINPGALGKEGFHKFRTMILLEIENEKITDLKAIDFGKK